MLIRLFILLPHLLKIFVDGGYKQGVIDWAKAMFGFLLEVVKRPNLPRFVVLPKRWIVDITQPHCPHRSIKFRLSYH